DRTIDRGLSAFHMKHNLTFNWTYDLPFARNTHGVIAAVARGWQVNNITSISSGPPFTVQIAGYNRSGNLNTTNFSLNERPNLKPGRSNNPILGGPDRYWDVAVPSLRTAFTSASGVPSPTAGVISSTVT